MLRSHSRDSVHGALHPTVSSAARSPEVRYAPFVSTAPRCSGVVPLGLRSSPMAHRCLTPLIVPAIAGLITTACSAPPPASPSTPPPATAASDQSGGHGGHHGNQV